MTTLLNNKQYKDMKTNLIFCPHCGEDLRRALDMVETANNTNPPVNVTAIIVMNEEIAQKLAAKIPDSIIVNKVRQHVKKEGSTGLAGDILNIMK